MECIKQSLSFLFFHWVCKSRFFLLAHGKTQTVKNHNNLIIVFGIPTSNHRQTSLPGDFRIRGLTFHQVHALPRARLAANQKAGRGEFAGKVRRQNSGAAAAAGRRDLETFKFHEAAARSFTTAAAGGWRVC